MFRFGKVCAGLAGAILPVMALSVVQASAYTLEGVTWSGGVGSLQIYNSNLSSSDVSVMQNAASEWANTPTPVAYNWTSYSSSADIKVSSAYNSSVSWDGITTYNSSGGHFVAGSVVVQLNDYWFWTIPYTYDEEISVAAHELGHTLGLNHSSIASALMYYSTSRYTQYGTYTPQQDDINGVNAMY